MSLVQKDVRYLNKSFGEFRENLVNFVKTYYKNTYNDFNESDPGMMYLEMAAYVGDVLGMYGDLQLKESLPAVSEELSNVLLHAHSHGYKVKSRTPAVVQLDVYQIVPAIGTGINVKPDLNYGLVIRPNMFVKSKVNNEVQFRTIDTINFRFSSSSSPLNVEVYAYDNSQVPTYFLLKKTVKAISGKLKTTTFNFTSPHPYDKVTIPDADVLEILNVIDSDGNEWKEVDYLAQDTIFEQVDNIPVNDPELSAFSSQTPFLLKLKKTSRRFITRVPEPGRLNMQFGAGISSDLDEEIIPNTDLIGNSLPYYNMSVGTALDPSNFLYSRAYGLAPSDTTLTVQYTVGGGLKDNVPANTLQEVGSVVFDIDETNLNANLIKQAKESLAVNNPEPATGGIERRDVDSIRNETLAFFAAQNRCVTNQDYIIRAYSMPAKYGAIAKAYITPDSQLNSDDPNDSISNPLALNLYVLGYNDQGQLTQLNKAIKHNLKNYLSYYRILTDAINIKNAFIINIGVNFEIMVQPNFNSHEVLLRCVERLKNYFRIDRWQINQPIVIAHVYNEISQIQGVLSVVSVSVENLYEEDSGYSGNVYSIKEATRNNVIYPSLDPSIFEVKYPNQDIQGRVVNL